MFLKRHHGSLGEEAMLNETGNTTRTMNITISLYAYYKFYSLMISNNWGKFPFKALMNLSGKIISHLVMTSLKMLGDEHKIPLHFQ